MSYKSEGNPYKGIPFARDSLTLLKPPCEINHPVAYGILSIGPWTSNNYDVIIPGDLK